jgi:hypothetical protein
VLGFGVCALVGSEPSPADYLCLGLANVRKT